MFNYSLEANLQQYQCWWSFYRRSWSTKLYCHR